MAIGRALFVQVVVGEDDLAGEAELAEPGDEDAVKVQFVLAQAVEGGARIAMMVVVVAVPEGDCGKKDIVHALVSQRVVLITEGVAEGVDRPDGVLEEHGAEAGGEDAAPGVGGAAKCVANEPWDGERKHRPDVVGAVVEADDGVAFEVTAVDVSVGDGRVEHPPDVGVEKASKGVSVETVAVDDGTVRVAAVVSLGVVAQVVGNPGKERALEGHGAGGTEYIGDPWVGFETLVGKVAVEADTGAHADDEIAEDEGDDFDGVDGMGAEPEEAANRTGEGDADQEGVGDFLFQSAPAEDNAQWCCDRYGLGQRGDCHCARSISPLVT